MSETTIDHEWRYRGGQVVCQLCDRVSRGVRCPKCGSTSSESTIGHGRLGGKMCNWRPADVPCVGAQRSKSTAGNTDGTEIVKADPVELMVEGLIRQFRGERP